MEQNSSRPGQRRSAVKTPLPRVPGTAIHNAAQRSNLSVDYQDVPRPVAALADEYESGAVQARHSHKRAQLLYSICGVASVTTDQASYVLPPQRALWIPSGVAHEMSCRGHVSLRTLYIDERVRGDLPDVCRVFEVSDLLRELIL